MAEWAISQPKGRTLEAGQISGGTWGDRDLQHGRDLPGLCHRDCLLERIEICNPDGAGSHYQDARQEGLAKLVQPAQMPAR